MIKIVGWIFLFIILIGARMVYADALKDEANFGSFSAYDAKISELNEKLKEYRSKKNRIEKESNKLAEKIVKDVVAKTGVDATVEKVTDMLKIAGYGVMGTPAVVIDGEVKISGKVPKPKEVQAWLGK